MLGAAAGLSMMFFSPSLTTQPSRDCQVFKVAKTPITSYVLKPVVQQAECKPQIIKENCEPAQEEPKPRKRRHRRW